MDNSEKGGGGWTKEGNRAAGGMSTATMTTLSTTRGEEATTMITIMTMIMTTTGGGCKGTAHPGVGRTYNVIMILPNANMRSFLLTTLVLATAVMMILLVAVRGGLV